MSEKMCKRCLVGKQSRNAFNSYLPTSSSTALELVHMCVVLFRYHH